MSTPIKSMSKLLTPRILSPISPNFLSIFNKEVGNKYERKSRVAQRLDFSKSPQRNHVKSSVEIKIESIGDDIVKDVQKYDVLINTPNKQKIIKNGIKDEKLFNILGRGGFGKVFKAKYKDNTVAMKLVRKTNHIGEKNMLMLNHKNIVTVLEVIESEKAHFCIILMEYLENCSTLQHIFINPETGFSELLKYAVDICEGIQYCHSNKVLHLDLKPSNILIINGTCKICDFGNSVMNVEYMDHFQHHGTIHYTAPEILLGQKPNEKSDIYSLGIIFWQLKTREIPYAEIDNIECIIYKVVKCNLRPELEKPIDEFSNLYHQCWNQNQFARPNVSEILEKISTVNC